MSYALDSSKRRRLLHVTSPTARCISDLPTVAILYVGNYLDAPSRLFYAAALISTNQNTPASNERNTSIVDREWSTLDFGDMKKDLVARLSDGDVSAVLRCIDAANKLTTLKLTNCICITGTGLEPLRGSTTIKQIDLSLVGKHQSPYLDPEPSISCDDIVPILDSIIEMVGCSLRHLHFPSAWRQGESNVQFEQFLLRYNNMLVNHGVVSCLKCDENLPPGNISWIDMSETSNGNQNYKCYECLGHYCESCPTDDGGEDLLKLCSCCEKALCAFCQSMKECSICETYKCVDCCKFAQCSCCNQASTCTDCIASGRRESCSKCERLFCANCEYMTEHCNSCEGYFCDDCCNISRCESCSVFFCHDCNMARVNDIVEIDGYGFCSECLVSNCLKKNCHDNIGYAGPYLLEKYKEIHNGCVEINAENEMLKEQADQMQNRLNFLEEQLLHQNERVKELEETMK